MIYWFDILALHLRDLFSNPVQSGVTRDPPGRKDTIARNLCELACNTRFAGKEMAPGCWKGQPPNQHIHIISSKNYEQE